MLIRSVDEHQPGMGHHDYTRLGHENSTTFRVWSALVFVAGLLSVLAVVVLYWGEQLPFPMKDKVKSCVGNQCFHWPKPPPTDQYAQTARYVMHISEWGSLSTVSTHKGIEGFPFVNIFSVSDGPINNASGVPYFYLSEWELSAKDIRKDARVSLTLSENQSNYCYIKNFDAEDPRCAHVIFTGQIVKVEENSTEEDFARNALFSRHPEMPGWPTGHHWFFAKLEIKHIYVLDHFGGAATVLPEDYFKQSPW